MRRVEKAYNLCPYEPINNNYHRLCLISPIVICIPGCLSVYLYFWQISCAIDGRGVVALSVFCGSFGFGRAPK